MKRMVLTHVLLLAVAASTVSAGPIIKPRKYYGPIPQQSLTLRVGFLGGATNQEMIDFLDRDKTGPERAFSDDFGSELALELAYMYKPHPQFGVRANLALTLLQSTGSGFFVDESAAVPDTVPKPVLDYQRTVDSDLITIELSGVYYLSDASVKEFQPYLGGGFTVGLPHEKFLEKRTDQDTGQPVDPVERDQWSVQAGVHAVLGAFYYLTNRLAVSAEGRYQLLQSKFPLTAKDEDGRPEDVRFVVDYTGFYLSVGISRGF